MLVEVQGSGLIGMAQDRAGRAQAEPPFVGIVYRAWARIATKIVNGHEGITR